MRIESFLSSERHIVCISLCCNYCNSIDFTPLLKVSSTCMVQPISNVRSLFINSPSQEHSPLLAMSTWQLWCRACFDKLAFSQTRGPRISQQSEALLRQLPCRAKSTAICRVWTWGGMRWWCMYCLLRKVAAHNQAWIPTWCTWLHHSSRNAQFCIALAQSSDPLVCRHMHTR